ncbi:MULTISPECIES: hypothetical protein [unclassified Thalassotalea]|uniref:hypothetical protein n=1 Tax=unclassified Thalassotalea TaxID=2614972 RepID=UPI001081FBBF|nr:MULTISPECIES: hypothetical protein [unclassified Thalassotalea]NMP17186.1 hypothetical protein [Thalassotalea sp. Y01]QBY03884.1 hypothetical protein E2K93_05585 [Thalassotalea sp. HSM 43]
MAGQGSGGNVLAAICSFFIPGLGQLVQGRIMAAIIFFIFCAVLYGTVVLWFVGVIFHLWAIIDAARYKG